ncbi:hypothetical protein PSHT_06738 [Puccinia striiformis]|uniref:SWR1-complex protein 4 n=1 Tax=Puccinia striiformis TaxID=27350 RepID=A0A2S4W3M9_9BASI|nr:hypothetical protein PSHT_06738 [Puccinia striiformis]
MAKMNEQEEQSKLVQLIGNNVPSIPLEILKTNSNNRANTVLNPDIQLDLSPDRKPSQKGWIETQTLGTNWMINRMVRKSIDLQDTIPHPTSSVTRPKNIIIYSEMIIGLKLRLIIIRSTEYVRLRFPVVHDRYEFGGSHERSLDDLKARYYSICQNLIPHRPNLLNSSSSTTTTHLIEDPHKKQLIQSYHFDKQREIERKKHVKSLLNRSSTQLKEEEFIYIETRRLEQNLLKKLKNRDELMKVIGGFQHHFLNEMKFWPIVEPSPTTLQLSRQAIINSHLNSANNLLLAQQQTESGSRVATNPVDKRHLTTTDDVPNDEEMMSMGYPSRGTDPQIALANDKKHCIHRSDSQPVQTGHCRTVGLRSTRITLPKTVAASTRISSVLSEMQIPNLLAYLPKPLIMPTRQNVESYERLILATHQLIDLRRIADRVDNDLKAHRKKKDSLLVSHINPSSSSSVDLIQPHTEIDNHTPPPPPPADTKPLIESDLPPTRIPDPSSDLPKSSSSLINKKRSASIGSDSSSSSSTVDSSSTTIPQQHQHQQRDRDLNLLVEKKFESIDMRSSSSSSLACRVHIWQQFEAFPIAFCPKHDTGKDEGEKRNLLIRVGRLDDKTPGKPLRKCLEGHPRFARPTTRFHGDLSEAAPMVNVPSSSTGRRGDERHYVQNINDPLDKLFWGTCLATAVHSTSFEPTDPHRHQLVRRQERPLPAVIPPKNGDAANGTVRCGHSFATKNPEKQPGWSSCRDYAGTSLYCPTEQCHIGLPTDTPITAPVINRFAFQNCERYSTADQLIVATAPVIGYMAHNANGVSVVKGPADNVYVCRWRESNSINGVRPSWDPLKII